METKKVTKTGAGLGTIVFTIFLVLKLAQIGLVVDWSWWWVFSPFWIPVVLIVAIYIIVLFVGGIIVVFKKRDRPDITNVPKTSKFQQRLEQMERDKK